MNIDAISWAYEAKMPESVKGSVHAVLIALCYSLNYKTRQCNPRMCRLAAITRLDVSTIKKAIRILKQENLIKLSSGKRMRKSNSYVINFERMADRQTSRRQTLTRLVTTDKGEISPTATPVMGENSTLVKGENSPTENIKQFTNNSGGGGISSSEITTEKSLTTTMMPPPPPPVTSAKAKTESNDCEQDDDDYGKILNLVNGNIDEFINWGDYEEDYDYQNEAMTSLTDLMSLYKNPTKKNLKEVIDCIGWKLHYDWLAVNEVRECIESAIENGTRIGNMHKYVLKCLRTRAEDEEAGDED